MHPKTLVAALSLSLTCAACDDGGGGTSTEPVEHQGTVDKGKETGQTSQALTTIPEGADADQGQSAITAVGESVMGWVNTWRGAEAQSAAQGLSSARQAQVSEASQEFSYEDGHLVANVNYGSGQTTVHYAVDLQIDDGESGQTITGTFNFDLKAAVATYEVDQVYDAEYRGLTLDADGCPVGGGITVDYSFELGGEFFEMLPAEQRAQINEQSGGSGRLEADYGPECGDVTVLGG